MRYYEDTTRKRKELTIEDLNQLRGELVEAYDLLAMRKVQYHFAAEEELEAKADLERKRLLGLANGTIEGRNTDQREAAARVVLVDEYQRLDNAEVETRDTKHKMDLVYIVIDELRARLRIAEVQERLHYHNGNTPS